MSNNFFWIDNPCPLCKHGPEMHIGNLTTQGFTFRGWSKNSPVPEIAPTTWRQWRQVLLERRGIVQDDTGAKVDFPIAWIESLPKATRHKPLERFAGIPSFDRYDADGYVFIDSEFC